MKKLLVLSACILLLTGCQSEAPEADPLPPPSADANRATASSPEATPDQSEPPEEEYVLPDPWSDEPMHQLENREEQLEGDVIEIRERLFVAQTNDIYLNPDDYFGRTIHYEGFYTIFTDPMTGESFHYIGRNGPGCCANDTIAGFEIRYDGELPQVDDWVDVRGHIAILEGDNVLILQVDSLTVKEERGLETVKS